MEMVYWILDPIIAFLAALRITPNMVTLFSLVPAAGAGVALGFGWFGLASVLATLATFCDIVDGLLARKTGLSSAAGEVIDAAVDRYGELFFFGGLVYYYRVARPGAVHRARGAGRARSWSATRPPRPRRWASPPRAARCAGASGPPT